MNKADYNEFWGVRELERELGCESHPHRHYAAALAGFTFMFKFTLM